MCFRVCLHGGPLLAGGPVSGTQSTDPILWDLAGSPPSVSKKNHTSEWETSPDPPAKILNLHFTHKIGARGFRQDDLLRIT